jgi:hypothetical protein
MVFLNVFEIFINVFFEKSFYAVRLSTRNERDKRFPTTMRRKFTIGLPRNLAARAIKKEFWKWFNWNVSST